LRLGLETSESVIMAISVTQQHSSFFGVVGPINLRDTVDETVLAEIRGAMDKYAVLVFRDQQFTDDEHTAFAKRLDGELHTKTGAAALTKSRLGTEAVTNISNVASDKTLMKSDDRRRLYGLANRLWHTDASFQDPAGRYSMLHAQVLPRDRADTLFSDMRAAYDGLDEGLKVELEGLQCHHSIAYSRTTLGFEFSEDEHEKLKGAVHPLIRTLPRIERKALYLASHISSIIGWELPEARILIKELMEHATQPQFVHAHQWRDGDLVIWDNRATMHRATRYDDANQRRELRRVTTLDIAEAPAIIAAE
jgi:alpha-ketoglutarate-dependent 2,4-dichlorophenoxyacetate dioxygenase